MSVAGAIFVMTITVGLTAFAGWIARYTKKHHKLPF